MKPKTGKVKIIGGGLHPIINRNQPNRKREEWIKCELFKPSFSILQRICISKTKIYWLFFFRIGNHNSISILQNILGIVTIKVSYFC